MPVTPLCDERWYSADKDELADHESPPALPARATRFFYGPAQPATTLPSADTCFVIRDFMCHPFG